MNGMIMLRLGKKDTRYINKLYVTVRLAWGPRPYLRPQSSTTISPHVSFTINISDFMYNQVLKLFISFFFSLILLIFLLQKLNVQYVVLFLSIVG